MRSDTSNLKTDFHRIAIKHDEEVTNLQAKQQDYVDKIAQELLMVGEHFPAASTQAEEKILNTLSDDKEPAESG